MTQNNHSSLCITISDEYKLQVKVIDEQDKDNLIKCQITTPKNATRNIFAKQPQLAQYRHSLKF